MPSIRPILLWCAIAATGLLGLHCRSDMGPTRDASAAEPAVPILGSVASFSLMDQYGQTLDRGDLEGKIWIATATFTRSRSNTPRQIQIMEDLKERLDREALWHSVRLINISAEPEHDSPEVIRPFAEEAGADSVRWRFVTGPRAETADLIESLGIPLLEGARASDGPLTMSPRFVLIDRRLQTRGVYEVYETEQINALLNDLGLLLPEAPHLDDGTGRTHLVVPTENLNLSWIEKRREEQLSTTARFDVFHDFAYAEQRRASGITFRNKIVDNAGKLWMPNHYDHGNGLAIADVDGDGLSDMYFVTQVGDNELWRNKGDGTFENITERAGVALGDRTGVSASFADVDNDGDPDLYVTTVKGGNALFENDGQGTFADVSAESGTDYVGHSSGAVFFDYDRDGLLDLLVLNVGMYTSGERLPVTNGTSEDQSGGRYSFYAGLEDAFAAHIKEGRAERSVLYRNTGDGHFEDVSAAVGLLDESWSGDATPIDANGDGWQDIYVLNMQGDDQYYENDGGDRFVEKSRTIFPKTPWGSMGVKSFDHDNDARMELFLTDMHSDMSEEVGPEHEKRKSRMQWPDTLLAGGDDNIFGNAFFRKTADGSYRDASNDLGMENYWPWGVSVGDLNADGFLDAFVASSMNFPYRYGVNSVLLNNRGEGFLDSEYILGVEPRPEDQTLTPWFELDCDGADQQHEYCADRSGGVVVWGAVGTRSSVIFDLDGDGDLDIVTNDFNSEPQVLVSDLSERLETLSFLKIRLVGTTSNRDGLGSRVSVTTGDQTYVQVMDGVTGYLSHGVHPLYFGLDGAARVDQIEVVWPSGEHQVLEGPIASNQLLEIQEP